MMVIVKIALTKLLIIFKPFFESSLFLYAVGFYILFQITF